MAMALHALSDDLAVRAWWCRCACSRASSCPLRALHGQAGLRAVERLDLALLVYRQHHRVGWRIEVKPDDFADLGGESRIGYEPPHTPTQP
jgi:hypothetical protein